MHQLLTVWNNVDTKVQVFLSPPQQMLEYSQFYPGMKETEVNEFMVIGLALGMVSVVMIAVFLFCHRKQKRRRPDHPMLPSHAHFHTCESIGERFATSSSMDSVRNMDRPYSPPVRKSGGSGGSGDHASLMPHHKQVRTDQVD